MPVNGFAYRSGSPKTTGTLRSQPLRAVASIGPMTHRTPGVTLAALVVLLVPACGTAQPNGPESALAALAKAADDRDDEAVRRLVCPDEWRESRTFAAKKTELSELDPRLADVRYRITDKGVKAKTDTTATGELEVDVEGMPDDLSPRARNGVDAMEAPLPVALLGPDRTIKLVKQNEQWVACR